MVELCLLDAPTGTSPAPCQSCGPSLSGPQAVVGCTASTTAIPAVAAAAGSNQLPAFGHAGSSSLPAWQLHAASFSSSPPVSSQKGPGKLPASSKSVASGKGSRSGKGSGSGKSWRGSGSGKGSKGSLPHLDMAGEGRVLVAVKRVGRVLLLTLHGCEVASGAIL